MGMGGDFNTYFSGAKAATQLDRYARIERMDPEYLAYCVNVEGQKQRKISRAILSRHFNAMLKRLFRRNEGVVSNDYQE